MKLATFFWPTSALLLLCLNGCTAPNLEARQEAAATIVPANYEALTLVTRDFDLRSYTPKDRVRNGELRVFIEGDGYAWERRNRPSSDPTPITQTVLALATTSVQSNVVYLARPCQFVGPTSRNCHENLWTGERYSEPVVASLNQAIDHLMAEYEATRLILVGYSGGGTIAALLAARRSDISGLVTLAAPLDITAFTDFHGVTPMTGSLNPVDHAHALSHIPQTHLIGEDDEIVPLALTRTYQNALSSTLCVRIMTVQANHWSGWTELTPNPADMSPTCEVNQL